LFVQTYFFGEEDLGSLGSLCAEESKDLCLFKLVFSPNEEDFAFLSLLLELIENTKAIANIREAKMFPRILKTYCTMESWLENNVSWFLESSCTTKKMSIFDASKVCRALLSNETILYNACHDVTLSVYPHRASTR
jgi:hypothetical protein